jgi:gluconokinase
MIVILMGVAGSGKTTVGRLLVDQLQWAFHDADEFHPTANIEKMRGDIALTDADRAPWLGRMRAAIEGWLQKDMNAVLTCSCLKAAYRATLLVDKTRVRFVYLKGSYEMIAQRLRQRREHFMKVELLKSQFEILEEPSDAVTVEIADSPEDIVGKIRGALQI